jgi:hypothetical protein
LKKSHCVQKFAPSAAINLIAALSTIYESPLDLVLASTRKNTFMRTQKGCIGYGSDAIQNKDLVVLFLGVNTPTALRQIENGIHHRLVAPVYVRGIIGGEASAKVMGKFESDSDPTEENLGSVDLVLT